MSAFLIFSVGAFEVGLKVTFLLQVCKNFCDSTLSADFAGDLTMWKSGAKVHAGFAVFLVLEEPTSAGEIHLSLQKCTQAKLLLNWCKSVSLSL